MKNDEKNRYGTGTEKKRRAGLTTRERIGCDGANEKNHKYVHCGSCAFYLCCDRDRNSMHQTSCFPLSDRYFE